MQVFLMQFKINKINLILFTKLHEALVNVLRLSVEYL